MCGIIGIIGTREAAPILVDGLKRLEYRGYDSAGIATLVNSHIEGCRAPGKLANLEAKLLVDPVPGTVGIGHTRWATHGEPTETNAHPHMTEKVAVVHNGIIENFRELRDELIAEGRNFQSDTDTEVVPQLITHLMQQGRTAREAVAEALPRLRGAFALGILVAGEDQIMIGARRGSPLAVGWGDGEMFLASDALALAPYTQRVSYLEDDDWVEVTREGATVFDGTGNQVERPVIVTQLSGAAIGKGNYRHFMAKEIHEQPEVVGQTLHAYYDALNDRAEFPGLDIDLFEVPKITLVACGTASLAALTAKYWLESLARIPVEVDVASEFRYRQAPMPKGGMALFVSQSGETADTLAALRYAREQDQYIVTLTNTPTSTMARESDHVLLTRAGPEIGVAATKTFTCQLVVLATLAVVAAEARGTIDRGEAAKKLAALGDLPSAMSEVLKSEAAIEEVARSLNEARDVLYLGRGPSYPIALEGALKLKEISYIHAEGYASGEMKHGPIALIDEHVPVIVIAPSDELFEKSVSNLEEVAARKGRIILITDEAGAQAAGGSAEHVITVPQVDPFVSPLVTCLPVQLLSYHAAVLRGTDVDQPRNLAKSVTVE
ncbi:MAG: glutamine--fructose-6-phosphate transaminase (isomerizing) [Pseudomonadota bacterium]